LDESEDCADKILSLGESLVGREGDEHVGDNRDGKEAEPYGDEGERTED